MISRQISIYDRAANRAAIEKLQCAGFAISTPNRAQAADECVPLPELASGGHLADRTDGLSRTARQELIAAVVGVVVREYGCQSSVPYSGVRTGNSAELRQVCAGLLRVCLGMKYFTISEVLKQKSASGSSNSVHALESKLQVDSRLSGIWRKLKAEADNEVARLLKGKAAA